MTIPIAPADLSEDELASLDPRKLAAVVYDDRVAIDALLTAFAIELKTSGRRITGVIQSSGGAGCGPTAPLRLRDVASWQELPLCHAVAGSCRMDELGLARAGWRIQTSNADSELVFASRFGRLEENRRGLFDAMNYVARSGVPLLTAVRRGRVHRWFEYTGGVGTVLDAHLWVLRDWWSELAPQRARACG